MRSVDGLRLRTNEAGDLRRKIMLQRIVVGLLGAVLAGFDFLEDGAILAAQRALHVEPDALYCAANAALARGLPLAEAVQFRL